MDRTLHDQKGHHRTSSTPPTTYTKLTATDITALTAILSHAPSRQDSALNTSYERIVREQISSLPSHLRCKLSWVSSFCHLHNKINPLPITSILEWLKDEVDHCIPGVWLALRRQRLLTLEQMQMLSLLEDLHNLWSAPPRDVKKTLSRTLSISKSSTHSSSKCAACILAQVGGKEDTIIALGAYFIGRVHRSLWKKSKRLLWIESWLRGAVEDQEEQEAVEKMWVLGKEFRELRKKAMGEERGDRDGTADNNQDEPTQTPIEQNRNAGEWVAQATADDLFNDEETWQNLQPAREDEPAPTLNRHDDQPFDLRDLQADDLFRKASSVYSQDSAWSQPSEHDTESELIDLYRHSTLTQVGVKPASEPAPPLPQHNHREGKDPELAKFLRHHLSPVTKPREGFF